MTHTRTISVLGLGYVGLPVAVAFGRQGRVIGFDTDAARVAALKAGRDATGEVGAAELAKADLQLSSDAAVLAGADFHIIAVPTPVTKGKAPDLAPLLAATRALAPHLKTGDIVVYESTVYPGATREDCLPLLEAGSNLRAGEDFFIGYSPERINPGDAEHNFTNTAKVIAAQDAATLDTMAAVYGAVIKADLHRAPSIEVAEAAKVIENTQRDLNIALMNELALICQRLRLDTGDVLAAAATKWNFLPFKPGLVGGHCVGVDPYYLTYKAALAEYNPQVILAGRRINDGMGRFIAQHLVQHLTQSGVALKDCRVTILGLSFKAEVPDLRNSRVIDLITELQDYGLDVQAHDPLVDGQAAARHGVRLLEREELKPAAAVVLAVPHRALGVRWEMITALLEGRRGLVFDVQGVLDRATKPEAISLLRL